MKIKLLLSLFLLGAAKLSFSQVTNIYQPNGASTNFGKVTSDSLNYYVVNYPALTLMKIAPNNEASLVTTLPADPFQTMIINNGKGIFPISAGAPFKLFDGTSLSDVETGKLPLAGYTADKVIATDFFHKGNSTYFRTSDKIYKTDYASSSSIVALATRQAATGMGIVDMAHTSNSIIYGEITSSNIAPPQLKRIDLTTGTITPIDSSTSGSYDAGIIYNDAYYYCTPYGPSSIGKSKVYKVDNDGTKTTLYTETASNKNLVRIIGVTPKGVIAIMATVGAGMEYVSISAGAVTRLNFNTPSNSLPCASIGVGSARTTNSLVYFETLDTLYTVNSNNKALWVTDGTLLGTKKVVGGTPMNFGIDNLSNMPIGTAAHCGNDLYFSGKNGANATRLIMVNSNNYSVQTSTIGITSSTGLRTIASGICLLGSPLPTSSAEKAIFKINCGTLNGIANNFEKQVDFEVYPNPNNGAFTLEIPSLLKQAKFSLINALGESVRTEIFTSQTSDWNLNLKPGFYLLWVEIDGIISIKKIIIE